MNTETWKLSGNVPVNTLPDGGNINAAEPARIPKSAQFIGTFGKEASAKLWEHEGSVYIDSHPKGASPCRYTVPGVTAKEWLSKWGYV